MSTVFIYVRGGIVLLAMIDGIVRTKALLSRVLLRMRVHVVGVSKAGGE